MSNSLAFPLSDLNYTIIVIDDGSTDGTSEVIREKFPDVVLLKGDGSLWWAGAVNMGVEYCLIKDYDFIHIMNDDIQFDSDFFLLLLDSATPCTVVGSVTLFAHKKNIVWKAGMKECSKPHPRLIDLYGGLDYYENCHRKLIPVDCLSGRSILIPKLVFETIGLFDQKKFPHGAADHEFCLRAKRAGFEVFVNLKSKIYSVPDNAKELYTKLRTDTEIEFFKSLFDIKYSWHLPSIFYFNISHRNKIKGMVGFCHHAIVVLKWAILKVLLPKGRFKKILNNHFQMNDSQRV